MAVCEDCKQEMNSKQGRKGCLLNLVMIEGKVYERIPYDNDHDAEDVRLCHDCAVEIGGIHHFGCDMEECPICGGQLGMGCDCGAEITLIRGELTGCRCIPVKKCKLK